MMKKITCSFLSVMTILGLSMTGIQAQESATIVAVGDTMCHDSVNNTHYNKKTKRYDYSPIFKNVKHYFKDKTIAVANLETTMNPKRKVSGYPQFNSPARLAKDLKDLGIDLTTTANNHCLDTGYQGIVSTIKILNQNKLAHTGTFTSQKARNTILMKNLNGIKTAFLAFTYETNGLRTNKSYAVNYIDKKEMKRQIGLAKKAGAQAIVVSMHWGIEYHTQPSREQKDLAKFLVKNGVNVILGSHPHVLQPMKRITVKDHGKVKKGFVIYSLGNFFSAQRKPHTQEAIILRLKLVKDQKGVHVGKVSYAPIYTGKHYQLQDLKAPKSSFAKKEKAAIQKIVGHV